MTIPKQLLEAKLCNKNTCKLQERIDKAIEYIEQEKTRLAKEVSNTYIDTLDRTRLVNEDIYNELDEVLDILKGSDKE